MRPGPGGRSGTPKLIALAVDRFLVEEETFTGDGGDGGPCAWIDALFAPAPPTDAAPPTTPLDLARWSNLSRAEHRRLVAVIQEHMNLALESGPGSLDDF